MSVPYVVRTKSLRSGRGQGQGVSPLVSALWMMPTHYLRMCLRLYFLRSAPWYVKMDR